MTLVAWILAFVGAGLAFAMCAGSTVGLVRRMNRASAVAVMPLPALAMYFTASELYALIQAGTPLRGLVFTGGPFVLGLITLLGVVWTARRQDTGG